MVASSIISNEVKKKEFEIPFHTLENPNEFHVPKVLNEAFSKFPSSLIPHHLAPEELPTKTSPLLLSYRVSKISTTPSSFPGSKSRSIPFEIIFESSDSKTLTPFINTHHYKQSGILFFQ